MSGKVALGTLSHGSRKKLAALAAGTTDSVVRLREPLLLSYKDISGKRCRLTVPACTEVSLYVNSPGEFDHLVAHLVRKTDVTFFASDTRQISVMNDGVLEVCNPTRMGVTWYDIRPSRTHAGV